MPDIYTVHLARSRFLPQDGGGTVFCAMTFSGKAGEALAYLRPGEFPEFEGEAAWFRVRWFSKRRREFLEQIDPPTWAAATPTVTPTKTGA
jgi:hypothetical protein